MTDDDAVRAIARAMWETRRKRVPDPSEMPSFDELMSQRRATVMAEAQAALETIHSLGWTPPERKEEGR